MPKKFLRRQGNLISKLGKGRKKKQRWKRPTGRDNKMREKKKGKPAVVSIGYSKDKKVRGKINEKIPLVVKNINDLNKAGKDRIIVIGNIGKKKKIEVLKKAQEMKIQIYRTNAGKYIKKNEKAKTENKSDGKTKTKEKKK